jgi:hypothetical protein
MPDNNKSDLTRRVTEAAALWLSDRGFKPVESEVPVDDCWVADLASACSPTPTEAIKLKLVPETIAWDAEGWKSFADRYLGFMTTLGRPVTAVIEVKVSRWDFSSDPKWNRTPPADLLYLAIPKGLLERKLWPDGWGILEFPADRPTACKCRCSRPAPVRSIMVEQATSLIYEVAIRRDHFTRYERFREFNRQARESACRNRMNDAIGAVLDIVEGRRTVEEALGWHGIRTAPATCFMDVLHRLEAEARMRDAKT